MKKILVIRYGALGDLIATLPVLQSLKQSGYYVTLAGNGQYREFFLRYGYVDEFIPSDGGFFLPLFAGEPESAVSRYLKKFEVILAYTDKTETFSEALKKSFPGEIIFHPVNPEKIQKHIVLHLLEPVRSIANCVTETPEIKIGSLATEKRFVIHPGSGSIQKNWSKENFFEVYRRLSAEKKGYLLLGYAEDYMKDFWQKNVPAEKIINSPDMNTLIERVRNTGLYIGNDSGISHLFAASGIPSVVIFGPTSPSVWSPGEKNVKILYKKTDCSPCSAFRRESCVEKKCLNSITVAEVMENVKECYGNWHNV